jgi:hypothetical protein
MNTKNKTLGLIVVTPAALRNIMKSGGTVNVADLTATNVRSGNTVAAMKPRGVVSQKSSGAQRGRTAAPYFPMVNKLPKDAKPTIAKVFKFIAQHKKDGITQKKLVKTSRLPNSTVWYALVKLRAAKAVVQKKAA